MKLFFLILFSCILSLVGCSNKDVEILKKNTAEVREKFWLGEAGNISASFTCGMREKNYVSNGIATEVVEFGIIVFELADNSLENCKFELLFEDTKYSGDLQKNPYDNTLVADIGSRCYGNTVVARLITESETLEIILECVSNWKINSDDIYNIVAKNYKSEIKALTLNGVFVGEIYIKILNDKDKYANDFYWYISLINTTGGVLQLIISKDTGEILSSINKLNVA